MTDTLGSVPVDDVLVDWCLRYSNSPDLVVMLDGDIDRERMMQENQWTEIRDGSYAVYEDGIYVGFQEGGSFENRRTYTIETPDVVADPREKHVRSFERDEITGTYMYHHTLCSTLQRAAWFDTEVFSTSTRETYSSSRVIEKDRAFELIEQYINWTEPELALGSDYTSYWCWKRDNRVGSSGWSRATASRDRWEDVGVIDCTVDLEPESIAGWVPAVREKGNDGVGE